ncbi:murein L,D-transpeptidase [Echinicola sp. 20G]|uniref:L,D-transpeptidase family protein n=1 Tax=Echinicola sp. 20G TaxID=2781961 RepID=UPI001910D32F|nr:L,D-transpeptidase family protein [Echinicola sp. 20G]
MERYAKWIFLSFLFVAACKSKVDENTLKAIRVKAKSDAVLDSIYSSFEYMPIWVESDGLTNKGEQFMKALEDVVYDGLQKSDYFNEDMHELLGKIQEDGKSEDIANLEILMSNKFLKLSKDLHLGKVDPSQFSETWKIDRKESAASLEVLLKEIGQGKKGSVEDVLEELRPENALYRQLRERLKVVLQARQEKEENVEPIVYEGKLEVGDSNAVITQVRTKLASLGYEEVSSEETSRYDEKLEKVVKCFQSRHGLMDDGVMGQDFWHAINLSDQDLAVKLKVNMERLRWLPDFSKDDGPKVLVNIPNFYMDYVEGKDTVFTTRAVVGKEYHQTPVFTAKMSYIVFSPNWTLPQGILWNEVIPAIKKDDNYLKDHDMMVVDLDGNEVDYRKIKWGKLSQEDTFPYYIRQRPSDENALGRVKFMFPNPYSIYIHDSPAKSLYDRDQRTFSHGCIRIEKPADFAAKLLEAEKDWGTDSIAAAMGRNEEKQVNLKQTPAVWILYLTAWNGKGGFQVREDIYDNDIKLAKLMGEPIGRNYF